MAMQLFKQRAVAVVQPLRDEPHGTQIQEDSLSANVSSDFNCNKVLSSIHSYEQQEPSSQLVVGLKFDQKAASHAQSFFSSQTSASPISLCQHQILFDTKKKIDRTPSQSTNHVANECDAASTDDTNLICAAMLYNMGLLCHKYAYIDNGSNHNTLPKTTAIIQASKMYELVIEFCNQLKLVSSSHPRHESDLMIQIIRSMAINNYAGICYELGNYVKYKNCMDIVHFQLVAFSSNSTFSHLVDFIRSESGNIYGEMKLNVLIYKLFSTPTLASAA
jgi:hypothetical protein